MFKVKSCMELEVNGRKYEFYCPPDSPLQDAVEANMQFNAFLLGRLQQNSQKEEEAKQEEQASRLCHV